MNRRAANAAPNGLSRSAVGLSLHGTPPVRETAAAGPATHWQTIARVAFRPRNWEARAEAESRRAGPRRASQSAPADRTEADRTAVGLAQRRPETALRLGQPWERRQDRPFRTRGQAAVRLLPGFLPEACLPPGTLRPVRRVAASGVAQRPALAASALAGRPSVARAAEPPSAPRELHGSDTRRPPGEQPDEATRQARGVAAHAAPSEHPVPVGPPALDPRLGPSERGEAAAPGQHGASKRELRNPAERGESLDSAQPAPGRAAPGRGESVSRRADGPNGNPGSRRSKARPPSKRPSCLEASLHYPPQAAASQARRGLETHGALIINILHPIDFALDGFAIPLPGRSPIGSEAMGKTAEIGKMMLGKMMLGKMMLGKMMLGSAK
jgi:hypothetical protein